jgi:endonuclease/exonuclease/phosphatase family metal-dependent hydrolase
MFRKAGILVTLFLAALLFLGTMGPHVSPEVSVLPSIVAGFFPYFLILNVFIALVWMASRKLWFIIPLIAILVTLEPVSQHFGWACFGGGKEEVLRLATFNVFGLKKLKKRNEGASEVRLVQELTEPQPNVICLQEVNPYAKSQIQPLLKEAFPYDHSAAGVLLLSQFEMSDWGEFDFDSNVNGCVWANIKINNGYVRVYCAHFRSNMVSAKADELIEEGDLTEKKTWLGVREVLGRYKRALLVRGKQAEQIKAHMDESVFPVVLCGDLNDHPLSYTKTTLGRGMKDSFKEAGCGWGTSYGGSLPLLRIDYLMAGPEFDVVKHTVHPSKLSDHHLVSAGLAFTD